MAELSPQADIIALRRPKQVFTQAYLNDPIQFEPDDRFEPETELRQLNYIAIITRDAANYAYIDLNGPSEEWYPVMMYESYQNREDVATLIDKNFRFFPAMQVAFGSSVSE